MEEHNEQIKTADTPKTPKKRSGLPGWIYYVLLAIFGSVFLLGAAYIGVYFWQIGSAEHDYDKLEDMYLQGNSRPAGGTQSTTPTNPQDREILDNLKPIYEQNSDTVGYLYFPTSDVAIAYPVMQSPYDEDFYLTHKFDKTENVDVNIGCPYVPLSCDVFEPSDNVIIYGHYLRSGGMFAPLAQYTSQEFWQTHQTFYFDTLYERHTYQIFAVFKTAARQNYNGEPYGYPYHKQIDFDSPEAFDQFIFDVKGEAFETGGYTGYSCIETDIFPQYGDKLLCLSTCEYTLTDPYTGKADGRLVIMAYRID